MSTYRVGTHHGVTICREDDGHQCGRPDHDCTRGHLVAVVVNDDWALAERICQLLNGPPYPARCTLEPGVRGCVCQPWPDCAVAERGDAPAAHASLPESAEQAPAGGTGCSEGLQAISGHFRFHVQGIGLHGAPGDLSLHCGRCPWTLHTSARLTLTELNQRADEHTEECR